jgi:hypothetical protein
MARGTATLTRVIGLALLVAGIGLGVWGYQMSESVGSRIQHTFTGSYSDEVMVRFIAGAVSCVVGLYLVVKK